MGTLSLPCTILACVLLTRGMTLGKATVEADKKVTVSDHMEEDFSDNGEAVGGYGVDDHDDGGYAGSYGGEKFEHGDHGGGFQYGASNELHGQDHDDSYGGSYGSDHRGSYGGGSYGDGGGSYEASHHGGSYGGKATSYQKITIHSGPPIKVYVKGHGSHGYSGHEGGSDGDHGAYGVYGSFISHKNYGGHTATPNSPIGVVGQSYHGGY